MNKKKKKPDKALYVAPALRSTDIEDKMANAKADYVRETTNIHTYSLGNCDNLQIITNEAQKRVRFKCEKISSSSNPKNLIEESFKDDDSSDYEDSAPNEGINDDEINIGANEQTSNDHWNKGQLGENVKNNGGIEIDNYQTDTNISNKILMNRENSDVKSHANHLESNETKPEKGLFFNSDDSSISDIEAFIDDHMKTGRVLTSTPNSDVEEQKVLEAAKFVPEKESRLESTLLNQSDIREITINTNRNKCDYNFEIYHGPSSVTSQLTDFSEVFGNNYIPPPVPPSASTFQLPPIHRLRSPISSTTELSVNRYIPSQKMSQSSTRLVHPRLLSPRLQLSSRLPAPSSFIPPPKSTGMSCHPSYALSLRGQPAFPRAPNPFRTPSSMPPKLLPQDRFNLLRPLQNSLYLHQRSLNTQGLESHKESDPFFIPPPVPPPATPSQRMIGSQQFRNLNQRDNRQNCQPSVSLVNKMVYDGKIWPQNLK